MAKGMRVKEVGATINLGEFSSLRVTIGEESEFAGLDIGKAQKYLQKIAEKVDGVLNLPTADQKMSKTAVERAKDSNNKVGKTVRTFCDGRVQYDHETHSYASDKGEPYTSVTQFLSKFYPFNADGVIAQEYMDFAASYGNLIHTAIQNAVIGKAPKKSIVKPIVDAVLKDMSKYEYTKAEVEQILEYPEQKLAGRFDIITYKDDGKKNIELWDVKTNSNLYAKSDCKLPDEFKKQLAEWWNPETIYGEHCLQLNLYAHILEKAYGKNVVGIHIISVPDGYNEIVDVEKKDISGIFKL